MIEIYKRLSTPPAWALKKITGGRLAGKTDINPQWRYHAMTEEFGLCGIGWKFTIDKLWTEQGEGGQVFAFALVSLYYKLNDTWSEAVQGIGGNMLIVQEQKGLYCNDEAFKMAVTDALSNAMKLIGVGADVYAGQMDTKYDRPSQPQEQKPTETKKEEELISEQQKKYLSLLLEQVGYSDRDAKLSKMSEILKKPIYSINQLTKKEANTLITTLKGGD